MENHVEGVRFKKVDLQALPTKVLIHLMCDGAWNLCF